MNNPKTIANTIKSMMIDINAEVVIADLIEMGFDIEKLLVKHNGLFKRNFSKDISDVYYDMVEDLLVMHVSHDSLYDVLPGGLFHHIFSDFNPENRRLEFEKLKEEEKNARKFFLPFDEEFFMQYVKLELTLRKYFKNPDQYIHHLLLFGKKLPEKYNSKLSSYLLFADKIIGNIKLTALCLADILGHDIRHSNYNTDEALRYTNNTIESQHTLNDTILGGTYTCGDSVAEDRIVWEFSILLEDNKAVEKYIEKENKQIVEILKIFSEYFIPFEVELRTTIICNKLYPFVIGKDDVDENQISTELLSNSYLGYNAVI